jgi:beta-lactamase class A
VTPDTELRFDAVVVTEESAVVLAESLGDPLPTASVGKLWLLAELAERIVAGVLDPEITLDRDSVEPVADSGLWQHLSAERLSVADAAILVASVSDNLATNALLEHVSLADTARRAQALGAEVSRMHDRVRDVRRADHPETLSSGSAREIAEAVRRIHVAAGGQEGLGITPAAAAMLEGWMRTGVDTSLVLDPIQLDPLAHVEAYRGVRAWAKTGSDRGMRADTGIVAGPTGVVAYAAIAAWPAEGDDTQLAAEARRRMRALGEIILRRVSAVTG